MHNQISTRTVILCLPLHLSSFSPSVPLMAFDVVAPWHCSCYCASGEKRRRDRGRDRDRWRDGIAVLMWHWGPSKVENLDIIDSYTCRSGNPIRARRNVLQCSKVTSKNSLEGPACSGTDISSYHHHKYQAALFSITLPALIYLPLRCPYLSCVCLWVREISVFVWRGCSFVCLCKPTGDCIVQKF